MRTETIGDATLYLGDCREILPTLGRVDCVLADPPYGIGFEYASYQDTEHNLQALLTDMFPVSRFADRGIFFASHKKLWLFPPAEWIGCVSWNTTGSYGALGVCQWTPFLFYGKDVAGFGSVNGVLKSDLYSISGGDGVGFRRPEQIEHPCPKPINIMAWLVTRFSHVAHTILDPFMGSGTTGVACARLGRKFIGIEIEEKYFSIACRRIEAEYRQPRLFTEPAPRAVQEALL